MFEPVRIVSVFHFVCSPFFVGLKLLGLRATTSLSLKYWFNSPTDQSGEISRLIQVCGLFEIGELIT